MLFSRIHPERWGISQRGVGNVCVLAKQNILRRRHQAGSWKARPLPSFPAKTRSPSVRACIRQANDVTCAGRPAPSDRFEAVESSARAPIRQVAVISVLFFSDGSTHVRCRFIFDLSVVLLSSSHLGFVGPNAAAVTRCRRAFVIGTASLTCLVQMAAVCVFCYIVL